VNEPTHRIQLTLESIIGTNRYWATRVTFLA